MPERYPLEVRDKNHKQRGAWLARWTRPTQKVVDLLGRDPALDEISRQDALALRDALRDRVIEGDIIGRTAQKDLQLLNLLWKKFHLSLGMDSIAIPPCPFRGLGEGLAKLDEDGQKLEVPLETIDMIIASPRMDNCNEELRDIILVLHTTRHRAFGGGGDRRKGFF